MYVIDDLEELKGKTIVKTLQIIGSYLITSDGGILRYYINNDDSISINDKWSEQIQLIQYPEYSSSLGFTQEQVEQSFPEEYHKYQERIQKRKNSEEMVLYQAAKEFVRKQDDRSKEEQRKLKKAEGIIAEYESNHKEEN